MGCYRCADKTATDTSGVNCKSCYAELACEKTGVGFVHTPVEIGATVIRLQHGHAQHFPVLQECEYFFAHITDACTKMCEQIRIIDVNTDNDTITLATPMTSCFSSNSRIMYDVRSVSAIRAIASEVGINVVAPLEYNCETRTLSINCQELRNLLDNCNA